MGRPGWRGVWWVGLQVGRAEGTCGHCTVRERAMFCKDFEGEVSLSSSPVGSSESLECFHMLLREWTTGDMKEASAGQQWRPEGSWAHGGGGHLVIGIVRAALSLKAGGLPVPLGRRGRTVPRR